MKYDLQLYVYINLLKAFYGYENHFRISTNFYMETYVSLEFYVNSLYII